MPGSKTSFLRGLLLLALLGSAATQLSKPIADDANMDGTASKYLQRQADSDTPVINGRGEVDDEVSDGTCPQNIALKWHTEIGSSIYATPLISDLYSDGLKDIIVPGLAHNLEVVEGRDGGKLPGFDGYFKSTLHASPLLYDIDFDGIRDILVATYDGEILFFKESGDPVGGARLVVPRLKVRRDWFVGLAPDHVDHSRPDVGTGADAKQAQHAKHGRQHAGQRAHHAEADLQQAQHTEQLGSERRRRQLLQGAVVREGEDVELSDEEDGGGEGGSAGAQGARQRGKGGEGDAEVEGEEGEAKNDGDVDANADEGVAGAEQDVQLTDEAAESFGELFGDDDDVDDDEEEGEEGGEGGDEEDEDDEGDDGDPHDDYVDLEYHPGQGAGLWEDDEFEQELHHAEGVQNSEYVFVDAHILATPSIADLDGDGVEELVVPVSYFFDKDYYAQEDHKRELGRDVEIGKYVASGVVVFDLHRRYIKWSQHLDLSTDFTQFKAYAYSAPTVIDLDRDGKMEIIMGTSVGFLYVLDHQGSTRDGWPLQLGEIQGQVAVGDVNGDGVLELVVGDAKGNLAAFTPQAGEVWERHLKSQINQAATFGDVDGDGELEVVVGTFNGRVHVLSGKTGHSKGPFPYKAGGRIMSPVLITKLQDKRPGMQMAVVGLNGILYVIDGVTGCADVLDIGESSFSMVLADDLDGNGRLDLLVATMNGNLYCIGTGARHHPLKAWQAQVPGGNLFTARWDWEGVYATAATRVARDVRGTTLPIKMVVMDRRPSVAAAARGGGPSGGPPYKVSVLLQGVGVTEMNSGDQPVIGVSDVLNSTGPVTVEIPCPRSRSTATVRIEMRDDTGVVFYDEFSLSFHMHFYRLLKWLVAAPFVMSALALLAMKPSAPVALPS